MKEQFLIKMQLPEEANFHDAEDYIDAAIRIHKGGMDPESPMFKFKSNGMKINRLNLYTIKHRRDILINKLEHISKKDNPRDYQEYYSELTGIDLVLLTLGIDI